MTGIELGLSLALVGALGLTGGKMWGIKSVEKKFLPRVEHDLGCEIIQGEVATAIRDTKDEIVQAIKENGNCDCRTED
jgi:hypothetical protein